MAQKIKKNFKKYQDVFLAIIIYFILTIIFTWPIIIKINSVIYGQAGDPFYNLWIFHNLKFHDLIVNFPFGLTNIAHILQPAQPLIVYIGKFLTYLFNGITAYNLMLLFSFVGSAWGIYLIVKSVTGNKLAAFFAGLIFAFCPYRLAHVQQHISLISTQWLIFLVYFLILFWQRSNWKYASLCGIFFALTFLDNYQYGFFAAVIVTLFLSYSVLFNWFARKKIYFSFPAIKLALIAVLLAGAIITVFDFKIVLAILGKGPTSLGPARSPNELIVYSAEKFNYLLPSPENPILGNLTKAKYKQSIKDTGSNLTEQTLYLGIIPLLLLLYCYAIMLARKKALTKKYKLPVLFFSILGLIGLYFSFAPVIEIFGLVVKTPAYWIFPHLPVFRVYARFGLLVILSASILAGIGLSFILEKIKSKKIALLLYCSITLLLLCEFINCPPFHYADVSKTAMPPVYQALEKQPVGVLAEYPLLPSEEPKSYDYLLWQTYHKFPLVYGAPINSVGDEFRKTILNPENADTITKLKATGVKYLLLHQDRYTLANAQKYPLEYNGGIVPVIKSDQVELIGEFGSDKVYKLN